MEVMTEYEYRNVTRDGDRVAGEQRWKRSEAPHWINFTARWDLARIHAACAFEPAAVRIWGLQDGYGEFYTPAQFDWSGVRDSTPEAIARMDAVASEFVSDADLERAYGLTPA